MSKVLQNKIQKRTALMESAYELFTKEGFSRVTVRDIAHKAQVAKGTFYLYFNDKEHLLDELIRYHARRLLVSACESMDASMSESRSNISIADKFIFIIEYLIDHVTEDRKLLALVAKNMTWGLFSQKRSPAAALLAEAGGSADSDFNFEEYISGLIASEGVKLRDTRLLLFTLLELVSSACYDALVYEEPASLEEYKPYLYGCIRNLVNASIISE